LVEEAIWREQQEEMELVQAVSATEDNANETGCTDESASPRAAPPLSLFGRLFGLGDAGARTGRPRDHATSAPWACEAGSVDGRPGGPRADTSTVGDAQLAALIELGFALEGLARFCDGVSPVEVVVERVMAAQAGAPD
jgi:hypothetical protein